MGSYWERERSLDPGQVLEVGLFGGIEAHTLLDG